MTPETQCWPGHVHSSQTRLSVHPSLQSSLEIKATGRGILPASDSLHQAWETKKPIASQAGVKARVIRYVQFGILLFSDVSPANDNSPFLAMNCGGKYKGTIFTPSFCPHHPLIHWGVQLQTPLFNKHLAQDLRNARHRKLWVKEYRTTHTEHTHSCKRQNGSQ